MRPPSPKWSGSKELDAEEGEDFEASIAARVIPSSL